MCIAFAGIFVSLAAVSPATAAFFRCLYALPVLGFLAYREDRAYGPRPRRNRMLAATAGIFFAADLVSWHYAIEFVGAGLGTVLANLQVVVVAFVAWWLLGERPDRRIFLGIPILLSGVVLISGVVGEGAYGSDPLLGVVFGIGTSIAYAGFILLLRQSSKDLRRPAGPLTDATAGGGGRLDGGWICDRGPRLDARVAGTGMAGVARSHRSSGRLALDHGVASPSARRCHLDGAGPPAACHVDARGVDPWRAALGCPASRVRTRFGWRVDRDRRSPFPG